MERTGLIDELIVVDSGSEDDTITVAAAAGPQVYRGCDVFPQVGHVLGKGEALWKSLAVSSGDLICWCDSDIRNFDPRFIVGLFTPLLIDDEIKMTKGFYRRPLEGDPTGGGRVTELVVRPLLHLLYPTLTGLIGPLSGEYALRRESRSRASLLHPLRGRLGRIKLTEDLSDALVQFIPKENGPVAVRFDQEIIERPPMANVLLPT